jgi:hypothetical protein
MYSLDASAWFTMVIIGSLASLMVIAVVCLFAIIMQCSRQSLVEIDSPIALEQRMTVALDNSDTEGKSASRSRSPTEADWIDDTGLNDDCDERLRGCIWCVSRNSH